MTTKSWCHVSSPCSTMAAFISSAVFNSQPLLPTSCLDHAEVEKWSELTGIIRVHITNIWRLSADKTFKWHQPQCKQRHRGRDNISMSDMQVRNRLASYQPSCKQIHTLLKKTCIFKVSEIVSIKIRWCLKRFCFPLSVTVCMKKWNSNVSLTVFFFIIWSTDVCTVSLKLSES